MCQQVLDNKVPFMTILSILIIIILLIWSIFLIHNMYMDTDTNSLMKRLMGNLYTKYLVYKHFLVYHKKIIYFINVFTIIILLFIIIYIDEVYEFKLAGWISGIGSFSAAIVALLANTKKVIPVLSYHRSMYKQTRYYIDITNDSPKSDFIELNQIYLTNIYNTDKTDDHNIEIPNKQNSYQVPNDDIPYRLFNFKLFYQPVKGYRSVVIKSFDCRKDKKLLECIKKYKSKYKYISYVFQDLYTKKAKAVPFPINYICK